MPDRSLSILNVTPAEGTGRVGWVKGQSLESLWEAVETRPRFEQKFRRQSREGQGRLSGGLRQGPEQVAQRAGEGTGERGAGDWVRVPSSRGARRAEGRAGSHSFHAPITFLNAHIY